jgi:asparagine synthase (glutamine-hydrolysing)
MNSHRWCARRTADAGPQIETREARMSVGFHIFARDGEAEFHVRDCGQGDFPPLVTEASGSGVRVVLMGRLYYRADLCAGLDLATVDMCDAAKDCDAALALAVYVQRGPEGLEHLEGDFALAIWDAGKQHLVCMRDPMGGYPIFYTVHQGAIAASTHMTPLLHELPGRRLNQEYLADYLMHAGMDLEESPDGRTVYHGIHRVLSGSIVVFHLASGKVEQRCYWDWLERAADPGTDDVARLGEQCLDRLRAAVRTRLRGRVASHLSGGMDSTGVALIARECLDRREPVHALSLVYERIRDLARERPYLESALDGHGFTPHRINADEILDFESFDTAPAHDEPFPYLRRLGVEEAVTSVAAGAGVATVMSGLGADDMFDMPPFHLTELLRGGRLWAAWSEASRWARAYRSNAWKYLGPYGVANLQPAWMRMGLATWLRGGYAPWNQNSEWTIAPWVRPDFARRMDLRGRSLAKLRRTYHACRPVGLSLLLSGIRQRCSRDFSRWYLAAPHGMMLTHPYLDPRVLSLGIGIQSRVTPQPGAQKPILAAALRGILPECILNRPSKIPFDAIYYIGLSRNLGRLEALIEQAPVDDLGFLDKAVLLDCLRHAALGNVKDALVQSAMDRTLALLLWLARQHAIHATDFAHPHREVRTAPVRGHEHAS